MKDDDSIAEPVEHLSALLGDLLKRARQASQVDDGAGVPRLALRLDIERISLELTTPAL